MCHPDAPPKKSDPHLQTLKRSDTAIWVSHSRPAMSHGMLLFLHESCCSCL